MYKKVKVVMIPTKDKTAPIGIDDNSGKLFKFEPNQALWGHQHLYFLSDDKIEAGDRFLSTEYDIVGVLLPTDVVADEKIYKIVASTNESLNIARIPIDFIEKYINAYNANQQIENVDVEYDMVNINHGTNFAHKYAEELKVDKNNTIQVKIEKDEDLYTKEQLLTVLNDLAIDANIDADYLNWWIKENI